MHRKRSQVAVVTEDGTVELNKNVVNGSEPMLRLIGDLPSGTPVAFEAAFGWGWLVQSHWAGMTVGFGATSIGIITLGDGPLRENARVPAWVVISASALIT